LEIPRGEGVLKAKILEAKYETKLELLGARGVAKQITFRGGIWIFSGTTHCIKRTAHLIVHSLGKQPTFCEAAEIPY